MTLPELLTDGAGAGIRLVILAHGAGQAMDSELMTTFARGLADDATTVWRFEFPYMAARRGGGKRRPPDRTPVLLETWRAVVAGASEVGWTHPRIVVGGKSMGGRMASMVADELEVGGLICLGYPFHPPGHPERLRIEHLRSLSTPALICQGERDPFGNRDEVSALPLSPRVRLHWGPDGNHDLKPRKASGRTHEQNLADALAAIRSFLAELHHEGSARPG